MHKAALLGSAILAAAAPIDNEKRQLSSLGGLGGSASGSPSFGGGDLPFSLPSGGEDGSLSGIFPPGTTSLLLGACYSHSPHQAARSRQAALNSRFLCPQEAREACPLDCPSVSLLVAKEVYRRASPAAAKAASAVARFQSRLASPDCKARALLSQAWVEEVLSAQAALLSLVSVLRAASVGLVSALRGPTSRRPLSQFARPKTAMKAPMLPPLLLLPLRRRRPLRPSSKLWRPPQAATPTPLRVVRALAFQSPRAAVLALWEAPALR